MPGNPTDGTSGTTTGMASERTAPNQSYGGLSEESATSRSLTSDTPYYVKALTLGIPAILIGIQLAGWVGFFRVIVDGHADFRQLYIAGYMVRTGHSHQLYDYNAQKRFQDALVSQEQIRSEEHTSELQSHHDLVCRLLLEKKKKKKKKKNNKHNY